MLNVLYCAFEEGILTIEKNIPAPNPNVRYFVSWQRNNENMSLISSSLSNRPDVKIKVIEGKGLSKNRNNVIQLAQSHASSDSIFVIADEDVKFVPGFESIISDNFFNNKKFQLLTFQIRTDYESQLYKSYWRREKIISIANIDSISSIEMAGRMEIFDKIRFEEHLGLGTAFPSGEETAFLADALRAGFQIKYIPIPIVIHPLESSGKIRRNQFTVSALNLIGGRVYRIYGEPKASAFYLFSTLKNIKKYRGQISPMQYLQALLNGKKQFQKLKNG